MGATESIPSAVQQASSGRASALRLDAPRKLRAGISKAGLIAPSPTGAQGIISILLETTPALVIFLDNRGRIVLCNKAFERLTGYRLGEIEGKDFWELFLAAEERRVVGDVFKELLRSGKASLHTNLLRKRQGEPRLIEWSNNVLLESETGREIVLGVGIDITDKRRLQKALLEIAEHESERIGEDLHDGVGQELTALQFYTYSLAERFSGVSLQIKESLGELANRLKHSVSMVRALSHGLTSLPPAPDALANALESLAHTTSELRAGLCEFIYPAPVEVANPVIATQLLRMAQEAVNNALKHSGATLITIALTDRWDQWRMEVRDNGRGFSPAANPSGGIGLRLLRHRCDFIGGQLEIFSEPGKGARIYCAVRKSLLPFEI